VVEVPRVEAGQLHQRRRPVRAGSGEAVRHDHAAASLDAHHHPFLGGGAGHEPHTVARLKRRRRHQRRVHAGAGHGEGARAGVHRLEHAHGAGRHVRRRRAAQGLQATQVEKGRAGPHLTKEPSSGRRGHDET
jgi:hypothetical protein